MYGMIILTNGSWWYPPRVFAPLRHPSPKVNINNNWKWHWPLPHENHDPAVPPTWPRVNGGNGMTRMKSSNVVMKIFNDLHHRHHGRPRFHLHPHLHHHHHHHHHLNHHHLETEHFQRNNKTVPLDNTHSAKTVMWKRGVPVGNYHWPTEKSWTAWAEHILLLDWKHKVSYAQWRKRTIKIRHVLLTYNELLFV